MKYLFVPLGGGRKFLAALNLGRDSRDRNIFLFNYEWTKFKSLSGQLSRGVSFTPSSLTKLLSSSSKNHDDSQQPSTV